MLCFAYQGEVSALPLDIIIVFFIILQKILLIKKQEFRLQLIIIRKQTFVQLYHIFAQKATLHHRLKTEKAGLSKNLSPA